MSGVRNYVFKNWVILSAKHGFLRPNDIVLENYDLAFDSKSDEVINIEQLQKQMVDKSLLQFDEIVLLAGRSIKSSDKVISRRNDYISARGCKGIGYMLQRLKSCEGRGGNIGVVSVILNSIYLGS